MQVFFYLKSIMILYFVVHKPENHHLHFTLILSFSFSLRAPLHCLLLKHKLGFSSETCQWRE